MLLVFIVFAGLMAVMVYKSMNQHIELVSADYYKDELRYQEKIDGANNAGKISHVLIKPTAEAVSIALPEEIKGLAVTGEILFYCPSQSIADRKFELIVNDDGVMTIDRNKLANVAYLVKLNWQTGNEKYYTEQRLELNK